MVDLYRNRWKRVAAIESIEQKEAPFVQRWRQLNAIMRMAAALGLQIVRDEEQETVVHKRWNYLKNFYLAESHSLSHDSD